MTPGQPKTRYRELASRHVVCGTCLREERGVVRPERTDMGWHTGRCSYHRTLEQAYRAELELAAQTGPLDAEARARCRAMAVQNATNGISATAKTPHARRGA